MKRSMNVSDIIARINGECDARFGEVIEKMLLKLRYYHTHQCWRKECGCEYCGFINGKYMQEKMVLHQLKKRIRIYEQTWMLTDDETGDMVWAETCIENQKWRIKKFREHKKELQKEIL